MSRTMGSPARMTRSVGARGHDREVGRLVALGDEPLTCLPSHIGLGPAHESSGGDLVDDPVGSLCRAAQQCDLVGVLDHAQFAEDRRRSIESGSRHERLQPEQMARPERVVDRERRSSIGTARRAANLHGRRDELVGLLCLLPRDDLHRARDAGRRSAGRIGLQPRHNEQIRGVGSNHQHGEALERHRHVSAEIAQVRPDAHEERRKATILDQSADGVQAPRISRRRNGRARRKCHQWRSPTLSVSAPSHAASTAGPSSNSLR